LKKYNPDGKKDPKDYIKRYNTEPKYKTWFDKNWGKKYKSIYEAVGLPEPKSQIKKITCGEGTVSKNGLCVPDENYKKQLKKQTNLNNKPQKSSTLGYSINSHCELVYFVFKNPHAHPQIHPQSFPSEIFHTSSEWRAKAMEALTLYQKKSEKEPWNEKKFYDEYLSFYKKNPKIQEIMKYNSIHPKLANVITQYYNDYELYRSHDSDGFVAKKKLLLLTPDQYEKDPECGKKIQKEYGDQLSKLVVDVYGSEESAKKMQSVIDSILRKHN
jgi:hypothetical protein